MFNKTVVMPKAQRPSGAGLAMPSFTGAGVIELIMGLVLIGLYRKLSDLYTFYNFFYNSALTFALSKYPCKK
ncbi:hypothetical protein GCM10022210_55110 [Mucilaginibacter dorajii]|uniref:DoxX family protein n=1 Tax=Mucilaginibacter dorajii TaxID=692994 RepID=A0ABP7R931_9SPHI